MFVFLFFYFLLILIGLGLGNKDGADQNKPDESLLNPARAEAPQNGQAEKRKILSRTWRSVRSILINLKG